jgi:hypothetical protein
MSELLWIIVPAGVGMLLYAAGVRISPQQHKRGMSLFARFNVLLIAAVMIFGGFVVFWILWKGIP